MSSFTTSLTGLLSLLFCVGIVFGVDYRVEITKIELTNDSGSDMDGWYFEAIAGDERDSCDKFDCDKDKTCTISSPFDDDINEEDTTSMTLQLFENKFMRDDVIKSNVIRLNYAELYQHYQTYKSSSIPYPYGQAAQLKYGSDSVAYWQIYFTIV